VSEEDFLLRLLGLATEGDGDMGIRSSTTRVMLAVICLSGLATAACTNGGSPSASATHSAQPASESPTIGIDELQGKILFTRAGGTYGDETLFTADANGTHEQRITGFGETCCPRWTPDGSHILMPAFTHEGRGTTAFVDPDGSHPQRVPMPPGTLNLICTQAFSLATGRLACEGWSETDPGLQGIYAIRASDGGDLVRVIRCSQDCRVFDFSPDGSQIYFFRAVEGFPSIGDQLEGSLYVINADGTDLRRLTHGDTPVEVTGNSGGRLSPDGRLIVFASSGAIWTVDTHGSALTKVFEDADGRLAITPTWSPDGRFILFGLDPPASLATIDVAPANGLYVIEADGTHLTPVIVSDDWKRNPDWVSPSG
jgi:hypothetical protein